MKKSFFCLFLFGLMALTPTHAQDDPVLRERLRGKDNLAAIMETVTRFYSEPATTQRIGADAVRRAQKKWVRYEWYMSRRLGPNGEFVNINQKLIEATGLQSNRIGQNLMESTSGNWTPVGPFNTTNGIGRVDRLAFHPTDSNIVYAGSTAGGLWKTINGGTNWTNISPDLPSGGISGIVIDPNNANKIYILTGDGDSDISGLVEDHGYMRLCIGVLRSTNGGGNWTKLADFPGADYSRLVGYRLVMHPTDNNILYACTSQGMYMTPDAGASWLLVNNSGRIHNMKFKPGSGNICYATGIASDFSRSYFWKSTTSGLSWDSSNVINNQINNPTRRVELAVTPNNPNLVYLLAGGVPINGNPNTNLFKGLYRSVDEGDNFAIRSNSPNILGRSTVGIDTNQQSNYDLALAVSNLSGANIVSGAILVWSSISAGSTWVNRPGLHGDCHDLGFHPANNKLWAATDGGVFSSDDLGASWTSHFQDMNTTQFYRMAVDPADYLNMIAGAQDNAIKKRTGATTYFDQIACCDGFALDYDPNNSNTIFAVTNTNINISVDGGANFNPITPNNITFPFSMGMAVHTSQSNSLFIGESSFWRSTNGGNNWTPTGIPAGWFIRTCPSNGNRIYAAGGVAFNQTPGNIRRSDDGGVTWTGPLANNPPFPSSLPRITSINVDPTSSSRVWITFGGFTDGVKVFYSSDAGGSWVNRSGTLPNVPVNCIALDNNNNAYLGTDNGVYYRGAGMTDWVPFFNNLPYVPVTDLIISGAENRIRAATFGRGIWSSDLYTTCTVNITVTGTRTGQEFHEASNAVTSDALLSTSVGTKVHMRGGNEVRLEDGFTAREMTEFKAAIGPCGSSGAAGFRLETIDSSTFLPPKQFLLPTGGKKAGLHILSVSNNSAQFEIDQKSAGRLDLLLTEAGGKLIRQQTIANSAAGKSDGTISTAGLKPGTYFLNLLLGKRVEHMQEIIIK